MSYNPNNPNGQATSANSAPVVIANDQSAVPVTGTFFPATQPISVSALPLPTGAATEATLSGINAKTPSLGQALATGSLPVVIASDQTVIPVSATALPLPTGAATETTLASLNTKTPSLGQATAANSSPVVLASDQAILPVQVQKDSVWRTTFSRVLPNVDTEFFNTIRSGTGQTATQVGGNLVITTGIAANAETMIRSNRSFSGNMIVKWQTILSQRIANNNFTVELVDIIGDGLSITANSATSVTVTIPNNPFTSVNIGQSVWIGAVSGIAVSPTQRAAISSISGDNVTFTVAGYSVTGSGTCSLFGWNYHQVIYTGTTATAMTYDAQRNGWASGASTLSINTTAGVGHMGLIQSVDGASAVLDQLVASATGIQTVMRASRVLNLPDDSVSLFLQIRTHNGTVAPASTTTWTLGFVGIENIISQSVSIVNTKAQNFETPQPVQVINTTAVSGSLSTVSNVTTVNAVSTVTASQSAIPGSVTDVASAALITTTTSSTIIPSFGSGYQVYIPVTVVGGTNPTLDIQIQESDDTGTNWYAVYDFPRITAVGSYRSPTLPLTGNRIRYVQTVGGTSPSFTRAIIRLQSSWTGVTARRQRIDRTIDPNTLNSVTSTLFSNNTRNVQLIVNLGAADVVPSFQLQGSENNIDWYNIGTPLAGVASSTVSSTFSDMQSPFLRAMTSTAGTAVTLGYVQIKGF